MGYKAKGTTLTWNVTPVGHIESISGPNISVDPIETTDLDAAAKTFIANIYDSGEVTLELEFMPDDTNHLVLLTDMLAGTERAVAVAFSDGAAGTSKTYTGKGIVTAYNPTASINEKLGASVTIKMTDTIAPS